MTYQIEVVVNPKMALGESILWNDDDERLYFVDIFNDRLHRLDPSSLTDDVLDLTRRVNSFAFRRSGNLIAGCWEGFGEVDLVSGDVTLLGGLSASQDPLLLNDGRCDPAGRFLAGQGRITYDRADASLFRLDRDMVQSRLSGGMIMSNGLAFSPAGTTLYQADSVLGVVWAFDYDPDDGALGRQRTFARVVRPDGATVDSDGCYWVASFGESEVLRFTPDGRLDRVIRLPTTQITMCAFGGRDLDTLFVVSGTHGLDAAARDRQELAGAVFAISGLGVTGLRETRFAG